MTPPSHPAFLTAHSGTEHALSYWWSPHTSSSRTCLASICPADRLYGTNPYAAVLHWSATRDALNWLRHQEWPVKMNESSLGLTTPSTGDDTAPASVYIHPEAGAVQ